MKNILFYITGHCFGHATRAIEVINRIMQKDPSVFFIINTSVPEWLFSQRIPCEFKYVLCENGAVPVQKDWRSVDKLESFKRYDRFIGQFDCFTDEQAGFIRQNDVRAIISDIPAAAFAIARKSAVPSFGITNFSWDWIYDEYLQRYPRYRYVVEHISRCYAMCDVLLRLPFHGDLSAFPVIEDIPLIARRSSAESAKVLDALKIEPHRKLILVYLGLFDYAKVLSREMLAREDYYFMTPEMYADCPVAFIDLLKAAAAVVTKPGYGIVSECVANQTPIMYTQRRDFREHDVLVEAIKKYAHNRFVPQQELLDGRWSGHLDELLAAEYRWPEIAADGADVAAARILAAL